MNQEPRIRLTFIASIKKEALDSSSSDFMSKVTEIRQRINLLRGKRKWRLRQLGYGKWINPNQATLDDLVDALVEVVRKN